eukprot:5068442-Pleurochrysis_carterae.AAC.1
MCIRDSPPSPPSRGWRDSRPGDARLSSVGLAMSSYALQLIPSERSRDVTASPSTSPERPLTRVPICTPSSQAQQRFAPQPACLLSRSSDAARARLAGSSMNIMEDVERAIEDGVNVVKSMTKDARF